MKTKTINNILNNKFDHFVNSIDDENVKTLVKNGTIITGGCITSLLLNEDVNDFDMYFKDKETTLAIARYYVEKFNKIAKVKTRDNVKDVGVEAKEYDNARIGIFIKSAGIAATNIEEDYGYFEGDLPGDQRSENFVQQAVHYIKNKDGEKTKKGEYKPLVMTQNSISLSGDIQLVIRFYGMPDEIHNNYDFIHCTNYWTSWDREVTYRNEALLSIMSKELKYAGSLYPICSVFRTRKFIERGWTINAGQYLKMCYQISKLDLDDFKVLKEQLIGVDIAYFHELLHLLNKAKKEGKAIDESYICQLIDEVF